MIRKLLAIASITLAFVHLIILYCWIFDWDKLVSTRGLICWIGSIFFGVLINHLYRKLGNTEKSIIVSIKIVFATTLLTVILGIFALIIEFTIKSMI